MLVPVERQTDRSVRRGDAGRCQPGHRVERFEPFAVAPDERQRVLDAIETLGYVKHADAAQLRGGKASTIGLVALDIRNPFFTELARGAEDAARENGRVDSVQFRRER
jgi:hypothetical protein